METGLQLIGMHLQCGSYTLNIRLYTAIEAGYSLSVLGCKIDPRMINKMSIVILRFNIVYSNTP